MIRAETSLSKSRAPGSSEEWSKTRGDADRSAPDEILGFDDGDGDGDADADAEAECKGEVTGPKRAEG